MVLKSDYQNSYYEGCMETLGRFYPNPRLYEGDVVWNFVTFIVSLLHIIQYTFW